MEYSTLLQTRAVPAIGSRAAAFGLWRTMYLLVVKLWGVQAVAGVGHITLVVTRSILAGIASAGAPWDVPAGSWVHRPAPPSLPMGPAKISELALGCSALTVMWWEPSRECPISGVSHCGILVLLVHLQAHSPQVLPVESTLLTSPVGIRSKSYRSQAGQVRGLGCIFQIAWCVLVWGPEKKGWTFLGKERDQSCLE